MVTLVQQRHDGSGRLGEPGRQDYEVLFSDDRAARSVVPFNAGVLFAAVERFDAGVIGGSRDTCAAS